VRIAQALVHQHFYFIAHHKLRAGFFVNDADRAIHVVLHTQHLDVVHSVPEIILERFFLAGRDNLRRLPFGKRVEIAHLVQTFLRGLEGKSWRAHHKQ